MSKLFPGHTRVFWTPARMRSLYLGAALIIVSIFVQVVLGRYSSNRSVGASYVNDIFLDNLPVVNLGFMIVAGEIAIWVLASFLLIYHPKHLLFGMKAIALYNICRSLFISMTHLGPYPHEFLPGPDNLGFGFYKLITYQGNYFFSGHTGFPFLMALVFWWKPRVRRFFLILTLLFGAAVLLAHVHYSIDVFAAPFIVYGTYVITSRLFPEDFALTEQT